MDEAHDPHMHCAVQYSTRRLDSPEAEELFDLLLLRLGRDLLHIDSKIGSHGGARYGQLNKAQRGTQRLRG